MITGTPLDLTPFGAVLTGIGLLYWLVALSAAGVALWLPKRRWVKTTSAVVVLVGFIYPVVSHLFVQQQQRNEYKARLDAAMTLFKKRCETAGERITRTVENVDGIVWMKWRSNEVNRHDQFKLDDPYGSDCGGENCIRNLLRVTQGAALNPEEAARHRTGYRFVETTNPRDGRLYRYTARLAQGWNPEAIERHRRETGREPPAYSYQFQIERAAIDRVAARYGVTWDDISTHEDREHWIAGGSLKVIDLQTQELIAERVGYMVDRGLGSTAGFRDPWGFAQQDACPMFPQLGPTDPRRLNDSSTSSNDTYRWGLGSGSETITDAGGTLDHVDLFAGITKAQLTFVKNASNLEVGMTGQADKLVVSNWYASAANQIEEFRLGDGSKVLASEVQGLLSAMAVFTASDSMMTTQQLAPDMRSMTLLQHSNLYAVSL